MRSLVPWSAYRELSTWHRDIDELFNRFFADDRGDAGQQFTSWAPAMEAFEKDGRYIVRADLPGVDPKGLEVSVVDNTLVLHGERKQSEEVDAKNYHYRETAYGRFERRLTLPREVDRDNVTARFENGVLEIALPLSGAAVGKKIPIAIEQTEKKRLAA